jgi:succinoglycan biosynthesis transport protein ExoP
MLAKRRLSRFGHSAPGDAAYGTGELAVRNRKHGYDHLIANLLPILWRRQLIIYASILFTSFGAFLVYGMIGERYEAYTLLRVGQGIKDRTANPDNGNLGEGVDLAARIDSLARIGATDHVLQMAASNVGYDRLFQDDEAPLLFKLRMAAKSYFLKTLPEYFGFPAQDQDVQAQKSQDQSGQEQKENETKDNKENKQEIAAALRGLITAKQEGRSDLLRISFRYPNPTIAADFLNQLANSLVAVQADLVQIPGAEVFFQQQSKRLELEAEKAAADLQNFSVAASIYSVADQRGLLLKRANDLATQLATTRGLIEERKGQKQAMMDQLAALKPVTQSKTVSSIVNTLGGSEFKAKPNTTGNLEEAPPLLLVRVYQDAMATLLKINTELSGYAKMERLIGVEIEQVNSELASLSSKEAEYDRLKRLLTRASAAADHYGTRMGEEQISSDIAKKSQFSSLRVVQLAAAPLGQTFPHISHLVFLALFGGFALGSGIIVMLELKRLHAQHHEEEEEEADSTMVEFSRQSLRRYKRELQAAE